MCVCVCCLLVFVAVFVCCWCVVGVLLVCCLFVVCFVCCCCFCGVLLLLNGYIIFKRIIIDKGADLGDFFSSIFVGNMCVVFHVQ